MLTPTIRLASTKIIKSLGILVGNEDGSGWHKIKHKLHVVSDRTSSFWFKLCELVLWASDYTTKAISRQDGEERARVTCRVKARNQPHPTPAGKNRFPGRAKENSFWQYSSSGPELIPSCKETQLIRFQSKVEALVPPARRHSMRIINLGNNLEHTAKITKNENQQILSVFSLHFSHPWLLTQKQKR